jgi:hypothetical protein
MIATLAEPFAYGYMVNAMWVSALVGGVCAFLSAYLMLKGWSLMGDALAHSIVPGVAGAYMLGLPFALGAFFAGILASVASQDPEADGLLVEPSTLTVDETGLTDRGERAESVFRWPAVRRVAVPEDRAHLP